MACYCSEGEAKRYSDTLADKRLVKAETSDVIPPISQHNQ